MSLFPVSRMQTELVAKSLLITTSWDDGHLSDLRFADLPEKGGLSGTFYVPSTNSECRPVTRLTEFAQLGQRFQIGGHTQDHIRPRLPCREVSVALPTCTDATIAPFGTSSTKPAFSVCACSEGLHLWGHSWDLDAMSSSTFLGRRFQGPSRSFPPCLISLF